MAGERTEQEEYNNKGMRIIIKKWGKAKVKRYGW